MGRRYLKGKGRKGAKLMAKVIFCSRGKGPSKGKP
jgi:hypothetical protein